MKLGEQLKLLSKAKQTENEYKSLKLYLLDAANDGKNIANITDFENDYPTIFKSKEVWNWLKENDIEFSGGLVGSKYSYTLWW